VSNRLVLLSGTPRAGTSTIARACAKHARRAGYTVRRVDLGNFDIDAARAAAWPEVAALLPPAFTGAFDSEDFDALPGVDEFLILQHLVSQLAERTDIVIVDAGQITDMLRLVTWLETVDGLARVTDAPWLRTEIARIKAGLWDAYATLRLVTTPDDAGDAAASVAGVTLAGFHLDGIVINRVPEKGGAWPKAWVKSQRKKVKEAMGWFGDLPVSRVALAPSAKKVSLSLAGDCGLDTAWTAPPISGVEADGDGYIWIIPMIDPLEQPIRVGYRGDAAYVQVGAHRRRLRMPSVVQRCTVVAADVDARSIRIHCTPDQRVWPTS
jgi:hypothetical protein